MPHLAPSSGLEPIFISVEEAATMLSLSRWACYQLLDKGAIEAVYQGRRRTVSLASLRAYAETLPTTPAATP